MTAESGVGKSLALESAGLVGLIKREPGFISRYTVLADGNADFVLIPEGKFELDGQCSLLEAVRYKVASSEGVGQG